MVIRAVRKEVRRKGIDMLSNRMCDGSSYRFLRCFVGESKEWKGLEQRSTGRFPREGRWNKASGNCPRAPEYDKAKDTERY